jgi:hypothetical protein
VAGKEMMNILLWSGNYQNLCPQKHAGPPHKEVKGEGWISFDTIIQIKRQIA